VILPVAADGAPVVGDGADELEPDAAVVVELVEVVLDLLLQAPKPRLRNTAAATKAPDRGTRMLNLRESSSQ
jgi:hypothetical protein